MDETRREFARYWLDMAAHDIHCARVTNSNPAVPRDSVICACQRGAEKAVKAFLLFKGISPPKTQNLRWLALEAAKIELRFLDHMRDAAALTPYAWMFRCSDDMLDTYPTELEVDRAFWEAAGIYDFVLNLMPPELQP